MKPLLYCCAFVLLGVGCQPVSIEQSLLPEIPFQTPESVDDVLASAVTFPVEDYERRRTFKNFGEYIQDRFYGYHVGDDVEFADVTEEVPVFAIADGAVARVDRVGGYGGVVLIEHTIGSKTITGLYGHLDLDSVSLEKGSLVKKGDQIGFLGDHESTETDGERKHLHFALYEGQAGAVNGYASTVSEVSDWLNPQTFFQAQGLMVDAPGRMYDSSVELGGEYFPLSFAIPAGWEVEYVPSIQSLNLFTLQGEGVARERSQIFIRYFDAADFLTLSTVTIHETEDLTIGSGDYAARRYDIEKKAGIADFLDQPSWRNTRHTVTDFRLRDGFTRYFVVSAHPHLDPDVYEAFLASVKIEE